MLKFITAGFAIFSLSSLARSDDWPRWRGPAGDGHVPAGVAVPETLPVEPKVLWRTNVGEGFGSPIVAGGRVFFHDKQEDKEVVHAAEAATGKELWKHELDEAYDDSQGKGARSTPLVEGDRLYVQSARGEFRCLQVADGKQLWRKNFVQDFGAIFLGEVGNPKAIGASRHGNTGSPAIEGDRLFVQAGGVNGASIVCLNKKTGEVIWKSQEDQASYAAALITPVAGTRQLVSYTAIGLIGVNLKDGALLWRIPIKTTWARHATTPVVVEDMVMVASHEHGLFGMLVAKEGNGQTATQTWLTKNAAMNFSSPVGVHKHLYGLGPAKNLICVEASTGTMAWSKAGVITTSADKAFASFLVMGKNILALTDSGQLVLFAAEPTEYREIARAQVCGVNWCTPAYAEGKLYLRDRKTLLCVELK